MREKIARAIADIAGEGHDFWEDVDDRDRRMADAAIIALAEEAEAKADPTTRTGGEFRERANWLRSYLTDDEE